MDSKPIRKYIGQYNILIQLEEYENGLFKLRTPSRSGSFVEQGEDGELRKMVLTTDKDCPQFFLFIRKMVLQSVLADLGGPSAELKTVATDSPPDRGN